MSEGTCGRPVDIAISAVREAGSQTGAAGSRFRAR